MLVKRSVPKVAELVKLKTHRGGQSNALLVRYHPGFKEAYVLVTQADGDHGPLEISTFGDDELNQRRVRKAWRDWEKNPSGTGDDRFPELEWTPRVAVAAFVRWLNSGGERRVAQAREQRRHGGRA